MHSEYRNDQIKQLCDQQSRFAPRDKKLEQLENAEKLLRETKPEKEYSYEYVCYRITRYRPDSRAIVTISGRDLIHDLGCFIEDLSDSADLSVEEIREPIQTVEELSRELSVSTKTISRWRQQGLSSRRLIFDGGRKRVALLRSSIDWFVTHNSERVKRGERFSQLTPQEKELIIARGRGLAKSGSCQSEVARQIAEELGRSVEAIRYTIKNFDEKHPDLALFPDRTITIDDSAKKQISDAVLNGISAEELAAKYDRSVTSIYRIVNEVRAAGIMKLDLDFMDSPEFHTRNAEGRIVTPLPAAAPTRKTKSPPGLPSYLAALYDVPLLTREQEYHLFRKFNFLKFKANRLRSDLDPQSPSAGLMDEIESLYEEAVKTKNQIVQSNLRLVVSIAKKHVGSGGDFFQLVSDGNMSLFRAAEKFDYTRGNKFSTYASWAIMKNFARSIPEEFKHRDRFKLANDESFFDTPDERADHLAAEALQHMHEEQIQKILEHLDSRERLIIQSRYGLDHKQEPLTLQEVGERLGVTKERIRQIEVRALNKLRMAVKEEHIELDE